MTSAADYQAVLKELQDWATFKKSLDPASYKSWTPDQAARYNGDTLSPAARAYQVGRYDPATGKAANGVDGYHFDEQKGQIVKNGGVWQLPETYAILAAAGGLGGVVAAPYIAGALASNVGGAVPAATAAGEYGPMAAEAGGYAGATTAADMAIPAALDPAIGTTLSIPPAVTGGGGGTASLLKQLTGSNSTTNAGISALTTLLGTHMANSAAADAAKTQADALKYSTDVQDAAAKRNELFLRQQAENSYANTEATRRANYDQWRAREARVSNLGAALGLGPRDIPNYVPGVDPRFLDPSTPLPPGATPPNVPTTTPPNIPGRAAGGPVDANQPYVVGENGPEVVVPNQGATVLPNASLWDPNRFAQMVGRPPTPAETNFYSKVPTWQTDVQNAVGGGAPTTPGQTGAGYKTPPPPTPGPTVPGYGAGINNGAPTAGSDLMSALTNNYKSLGATPTGPGSGPTDISYFARRIQETGGMTPSNIAYWFGPNGRIAQELKGAVPPETSGASGSGASGPYLPPSSFSLGSFALNPRF